MRSYTEALEDLGGINTAIKKKCLQMFTNRICLVTDSVWKYF